MDYSFYASPKDKTTYDRNNRRMYVETIVGNTIKRYGDDNRLISSHTIGSADEYVFNEDGVLIPVTPTHHSSGGNVGSTYSSPSNTPPASLWLFIVLGAFVGGFFINAMFHLGVIVSFILGGVLGIPLAFAFLIVVPICAGLFGGGLVGYLIGAIAHDNKGHCALFGAVIGLVIALKWMWNYWRN